MLALAACGDGTGGAGGGTTPPGGGSSGVKQLEITTSATQIGSSGANAVDVTVTAKNASNMVLPSVAIVFAASSGNLLVGNATTDTSGLAKAKISVGSNKANRTINVTATSEGITSTASIDVTGTTLTMSAPTSVGLGSAVTVLATLKDSSGTAISGTVVSVASSLGNAGTKTCVPVSCATDSSGTVSITYTPTVGGSDSVTLSALGAKTTQTIGAASSLITLSVAPDAGQTIAEYDINQTGKVVTVGISGTVTYPATIHLSSTAGTLSPLSVIIPSAGATATATLATGASVGSGVIFAQRAVTGGVSNSFPFEIVSRTPAVITLQTSPSVIAANPAGSSTNKATLIATVRDSAGNPVKGVSVNFSKPIDNSSGSLQSATATTNSSGIATTNYIAGPNSAAGGGVTVNATVAGLPVASATVTVAAQALFVHLGFSNKIIEVDTTRYAKLFSVIVTDAAGQAVSGANLSVSVKADLFYKGYMLRVKDDGTVPGSGEAATKWGAVYLDQNGCPNEDVNHNGTIQAGEDTNGNGVMDPGVRIAVTQESPGATANVTDSTGFATYRLTYLKQDALWSQYIVTVASNTAQGGAQGYDSQTYFLKILISDVSDPKVDPPSLVSPFGHQNASCASPL